MPSQSVELHNFETGKTRGKSEFEKLSNLERRKKPSCFVKTVQNLWSCILENKWHSTRMREGNQFLLLYSKDSVSVDYNVIDFLIFHLPGCLTDMPRFTSCLLECLIP